MQMVRREVSRLVAPRHIPLAAYPPTLTLSQRRRHIDILHSAITIDLGSEFPSPTISRQLFCIASEASLVVYHHNIDTFSAWITGLHHTRRALSSSPPLILSACATRLSVPIAAQEFARVHSLRG
ncbi:hypothetical protein J3E68DRAFT_139514 [Trichoderma sp. SZMC 28012]